MKITTKFEVGDYIYKLHSNGIHTYVIEGIVTTIRQFKTGKIECSTTYKIRDKNTTPSCEITINEDKIVIEYFKTKKEVLQFIMDQV